MNCWKIRTISIVFLALAACEHLGKAPPQPVLTEEGIEGRELYMKHRCFTCHGTDGSGNSSNMLGGKARDLRHRSTFVNGVEEEDIATTIKNGIPGTEMPAYPNLTEDERYLIADYIIDMLWEEEPSKPAAPAKTPVTEPAKKP